MKTFRNRTRNTILAERGSIAANPLARALGLMFRRTFPPGEGLLIIPCDSIHMMFVFFPIDVVFLNRERTVVRTKSRVLPWIGLAFGGRGAHSVLELPAGTITASGTSVGDQVEW